jgi:hypothetical protein
MKLRCSSLPAAVQCPASVIVVPGALAIGSDGDAARLGTAIHSLLADYVRTGELPTEDQKREVALKYGIENPAGDMTYLFWTGKEAWGELRDSFPPNPLVEIAMEFTLGDLLLTGHMDVAGDCGEIVRGVDWKSGRKPSNYYSQVMGYIVELFQNFPGAQKAVLNLVWLREKMMETVVKTRAEAVEWAREMYARVTSGLYNPGTVCRFCPRQTNCPALREKMRAIMLDLTGKDHQLPALTAETWLAIQPSVTTGWHNMKMVEDLFENFKAFVRDGVERFGSLSITDKTELRLVSVSPRKSLDTAKAWPIVAQQLTDEELEEVTTIKLSDVNTIVAKKAGRGKGKAAKAALLESLEAAEAVILTPQSARLTETRKEENTETKEME